VIFFSVFLLVSFLRSSKQSIAYRMNKVLVFALLVAACAAVVLAAPCDNWHGKYLCNYDNGECVNSINYSWVGEQRRLAECECIYQYQECLFHLDCNESSMYALMYRCTNEYKCERCAFFVQASSSVVLPSIALVLAGLLAMFM